MWSPSSAGLAVSSSGLSSGGRRYGSRSSGRARTRSSSAASRTLRAIGPTWGGAPITPAGYVGTRPNVGFSPTTPANAAGTRIEPPPSVPTANAPKPAATAATAPALLPPGECSRFQGLRVIPVSGLSPSPFSPNSVVVVLPSSTAPASRRRTAAGESSFHGPAAEVVREPLRVGQPRASNKSFNDTVTPSSSLRGEPTR